MVQDAGSKLLNPRAGSQILPVEEQAILSPRSTLEALDERVGTIRNEKRWPPLGERDLAKWDDIDPFAIPTTIFGSRLYLRKQVFGDEIGPNKPRWNHVASGSSARIGCSNFWPIVSSSGID
jgi:hypothetical protein